MNKLFLLAITAIVVLSSCGAKTERASGNYDSLFLDFKFGMKKQNFYDYCWDMNRKKVFTHGPTNREIEYELNDPLLRKPVTMRFYPSFYKDEIYEMPVTYTYVPWSPWNRQYWSDSLLVDMLKVYKRTYGDDFKLMTHETMGKVYYKFDKHRRINLFVRDDQYVQAVFTDMRVDKKAKDEEKAALNKEPETK
jgi:hypothetical protein